MTMNSSIPEHMNVNDLLNDLVVTNPNTTEYNVSNVMISKVNPDVVEDTSADCEKILKMTALSIKMFANSYYKKSQFLENSDIEQIKDSLNNYAKNNDKVKEFKNTIIDDLTAFQKQIKTNHVQKLADLSKEKQLCERKIITIEFEKNKLIMDRLSKVVWPYDEKTKAYDAQVTALNIKVEKLKQKIVELQQMKPVADEKDILVYKMHLKEKYQQK